MLPECCLIADDCAKVLMSAPESVQCGPERASRCHCLWRGQSQPQRVRQTRPRVRHRLPMCPPRRLGFARSEPVVKCDGRAMARRCVAPEGVRCDLSAASHGSSPPFVCRAADKPWSACAQDGASPPPHRNRFAIMHRSVSIRAAYRGSLSRATTSLLPYCRAWSRAVLPSLDGSVASAPRSRRRLTIAR